MADVVTKVVVDQDECISCEACAAECPEVFEMDDDTCLVKADAEDAGFLKEHSEAILAAVETCPVDAIKCDIE